MKKFLETLLVNIANLFKVKTLWSLAVMYTVCKLAMAGSIDAATFMTLASAIVMFYFNKEKEDDKKGGE